MKITKKKYEAKYFSVFLGCVYYILLMQMDLKSFQCTWRMIRK